MQKELNDYRREMQQELEKILAYWMTYTIDDTHGGFIGRIDNDNNADAFAPKGSVLNSRILWSFSAAYNLTHHQPYITMAQRAFEYIINHFIDKEYNGVFWTVNYKGEPLDTKKQIYALSFAMYGLSEFYITCNNEMAKELAIKLFSTIEEHSYDNTYGGYVEALTRDWKDIIDLRLSEKDANEKKSMNTHLHVLEGYANLYKIWPDEMLKRRIIELIHIFLDHIIHKDTHHLVLFFDEQWNAKSNIHSYGHDIEAAWLVQEAAEVVKDELLIKEVKEISLKLANAAAQGIDTDGGLWYEYDAATAHLIKEKHSWPQAEAMVGYMNAWQISGDEDYLKKSMDSWRFVQKFILNKNKGEWYWGVTDTNNFMDGQDKVGLWKCPYHNSRACIEIIKRINSS